MMSERERIPQRQEQQKEILVPAEGVSLSGTLNVPHHPRGMVLFALASGRRSPRIRRVAKVLQSQGIATLLFDLMTPGEELLDEWSGRLRFDIASLAKRLFAVTESLRNDPDAGRLPIGYFGAETGAAAALAAATEATNSAAAIASWGGRTDLAEQFLGGVQAATIFIVGGEDNQAIPADRRALTQLHCAQKNLAIVPGATRLFEEPGAIEEVARLAAEWFGKFFPVAGVSVAAVPHPMPGRQRKHSAGR
jgi:dienelactone hydrolase